MTGPAGSGRAAPTGSSVLPPDRPGSPGSLIVSFSGAFLRQLGGWIAVADLVGALEMVGLSQASTRQALVRLKARGFLAAEKRGSAAGYRLTPAGLHDLETGDRRIFSFGQAELADGWVLAVFSVPEPDRAVRHRLRTELSWLGFGTVAPGVWIAPSPLAGPAAVLLADAGLDRYVTWFDRAQLAAPEVRRWWDLDLLRDGYLRFLGGHRRLVADGAPGGRAAFAAYLRLVDEWRQFPRLDPGLPAALLPADWPAPVAWDTFRRLHERWHGPSLELVRSSSAARAAVRV